MTNKTILTPNFYVACQELQESVLEGFTITEASTWGVAYEIQLVKKNETHDSVFLQKPEIVVSNIAATPARGRPPKAKN